MRVITLYGETYEVHDDWVLSDGLRTGYLIEFEYGLHADYDYVSLDMENNGSLQIYIKLHRECIGPLQWRMLLMGSACEAREWITHAYNRIANES